MVSFLLEIQAQNRFNLYKNIILPPHPESNAVFINEKNLFNDLTGKAIDNLFTL